MNRRIFANPDLCTGCEVCSTVCAIVHLGVANPHQGTIIIKQNLFERYEYQTLCRHCDPAPCVDACMTHCITQDPVTRTVLLDSNRCVGCWMCIMVCPYDAIAHDAEHQVARKCDLCIGRDGPACVAACPTQALMRVDASPHDAKAPS